MIKVYAGIRKGYGKATQGRVCDDRILLGKQVGNMGYYEYETEGNSAIVAVSDGIGGCNSGWKAAEVALNEVANWADEEVRDDNALREAFLRVNDKVISESLVSLEYQGMAATLSLLVINDTSAKVLHVGDSRVYHYGTVQGHVFFKQITEDQNNMLLWRTEERNQDVPEKDFKNMFGWNHIISYVGMPAQSFEEHIYMLDVMNPKGIFILTSDGVHDFIEKKGLRKVLESEGTWKEKLENIMDTAVENGSCDDQSIIVVEVK